MPGSGPTSPGLWASQASIRIAKARWLPKKDRAGSPPAFGLRRTGQGGRTYLRQNAPPVGPTQDGNSRLRTQDTPSNGT